MKHSFIASTIAVILVLARSASAEACAVYDPVEASAALHADAVIVGHVWNYRRGKGGFEPFSVSVKQVMSGNPGRKITVSWARGSNIDVPDRLKGDYIFVLQKNPATSPGSDTAEYIVMQGVCSGAYIFEKGSGTANKIRKMFGLQTQRVEPPSDFPFWKVFPIGVLGFGVFVIGLLMWPRRW